MSVEIDFSRDANKQYGIKNARWCETVVGEEVEGEDFYKIVTPYYTSSGLIYGRSFSEGRFPVRLGLSYILGRMTVCKRLFSNDHIEDKRRIQSRMVVCDDWEQLFNDNYRSSTSFMILRGRVKASALSLNAKLTSNAETSNVISEENIANFWRSEYVRHGLLRGTHPSIPIKVSRFYSRNYYFLPRKPLDVGYWSVSNFRPIEPVYLRINGETRLIHSESFFS